MGELGQKTTKRLIGQNRLYKRRDGKKEQPKIKSVGHGNGALLN